MTRAVRRTLSECVHAVIFVVRGNDPHLLDGKYRDKLQNVREHLNKEGNEDSSPSNAIHVIILLVTSTSNNGQNEVTKKTHIMVIF